MEIEIAKAISDADQGKDTDIPVQVITEPPSYGTIDLKDEKLRERALQAVMSRFESVKTQHDEFVADCDKYDLLYRGTPGAAQNKDTLAKMSSMICYNSCEDWVATLMDAHFSINPPLQVKSKRGKDNEVTIKKIQGVLWQNAKNTHIEENSEQIFRNGVKYGTFATKVPLVIDEELGFQMVQVPKKFNVFGKEMSFPFLTQSQAQEKIDLEDRVPLKPVDIRNLYFRYDKKSWIIEKIISEKSVIQNQGKSGIYGNLEKGLACSIPEQDQTAKAQEQTGATTPTAAADLDGDIELLEAHHIPFKFMETDNVEDHLKGQTVLCLITVSNQKEVIRIKPVSTKEPPYLITPFIQQDKSELGIGIPQIIEPLLKEYNTRRNQSLDANTFGLYCMVVANMKYIKKPEQLKIRPNGMIELKGVPTGARVEDIVSFIRPPVEFVQVAMNMIDRINAEIVTTTRLKGVMSGEKISPNPSATEMSSIMKEALKSIKVIFRRVDRNLFAKYFEMTYTYFVLNRQKSWIVETTKMETNPQTGAQMAIPTWDEVTPEQIYSDGIDVEMLGATHMEEEVVLRHQNMQLLDIAAKYGSIPMKNELGQDVRPNFYNLMNSVYYTFGKEDVSQLWEVLPLPPQTLPPPPKEDKPNISFSFKGEDLMNPLLQAILIEAAKDAGVAPSPPAPPQGQSMQGGPGEMNLQTPPPSMANIATGATNPRAIREPIGGRR